MTKGTILAIGSGIVLLSIVTLNHETSIAGAQRGLTDDEMATLTGGGCGCKLVDTHDCRGSGQQDCTGCVTNGTCVGVQRVTWAGEMFQTCDADPTNSLHCHSQPVRCFTKYNCANQGAVIYETACNSYTGVCSSPYAGAQCQECVIGTYAGAMVDVTDSICSEF